MQFCVVGLCEQYESTRLPLPCGVAVAFARATTPSMYSMDIFLEKNICLDCDVRMCRDEDIKEREEKKKKKKTPSTCPLFLLFHCRRCTGILWQTLAYRRKRSVSFASGLKCSRASWPTMEKNNTPCEAYYIYTKWMTPKGLVTSLMVAQPVS